MSPWVRGYSSSHRDVQPAPSSHRYVRPGAKPAANTTLATHPTPGDAGGELAQWYGTHPLIQRSPVRFRARSHTGVMDYDEACFMHLTPGVVHNFPKAVGV